MSKTKAVIGQEASGSLLVALLQLSARFYARLELARGAECVGLWACDYVELCCTKEGMDVR